MSVIESAEYNMVVLLPILSVTQNATFRMMPDKDIWNDMIEEDHIV